MISYLQHITDIMPVYQMDKVEFKWIRLMGCAVMKWIEWVNVKYPSPESDPGEYYSV
jgi:hypothetical protein